MAKTATVKWHEWWTGVPVNHTDVHVMGCWDCGETDIDSVTLICADCGADNNDDAIPDSALYN